MILVDTSIWVDHLRTGSPELATLLLGNRISVHDFVIGELACGNLRNRREVLELLQSLPRLGSATNEEALFFIEQQQLMARGIGYVDVHLLAAGALHGARLWTKDKRLKTVAEELGLAYASATH
ncbi:MAG: PIN domain-containing protein [Rhodocyclaceae bacterium]|nr:PIN domain-containing protein [Rhodocyclaceae bacterium]